MKSCHDDFGKRCNDYHNVWPKQLFLGIKKASVQLSVLLFRVRIDYERKKGIAQADFWVSLCDAFLLVIN